MWHIHHLTMFLPGLGQFGSMSRLVNINDTSGAATSGLGHANQIRTLVRHIVCPGGRTSACVDGARGTDRGRVSPALVLFFSALLCLCPNTRRFGVAGVIQEFCPCLLATRRVLGAACCVSSTLTSPLPNLTRPAWLPSLPVATMRQRSNQCSRLSAVVCARRALRRALSPSRPFLPEPMVFPVTSLTSTGRRAGGATMSARTVVAARIGCRFLGGGF